jgi:hypothetical protein
VRLVRLPYFDADVSTAGARFAVRRLRRRLGEIQILAGFWQSDPDQAGNLCIATRSNFCDVAYCLHEAADETKADAGESVAKLTAKALEGATESESRSRGKRGPTA